MSEVIVVTSGKGGVGKTTTTANVGTGLAMLGKKVVMVDTDIGLRNLDVVMGLENRIVYNLVDVIEGNCRMKQALIRDKKYHTLYLLPSAQTRDKNAVNPEQMKKLTDELREDFDYAGLSGRNRTRLSECSSRCRSCASCYYTGGICNTGCRPYHRTSGIRWYEGHSSCDQSAAAGYDKPGRYDVRKRCV